VSRVLLEVRAAWDAAHGEDLDTLTPGEVEARLHELREVQAATAAYEAKLCARYDTDREWAHHGALSPAAYLAKTRRLPIEACRRSFRIARHLRFLPAVVAALAAGRIEDPHVQRIVAADNPRVHDALVADQVEIVRWAMDLPWSLFVRHLQAWLDEHDPDGPEPAQVERSFNCSKTIEDRWALDGLLDPIGGSIVHRELARLERQLFHQDWRDAEARLGRDPLVHELDRIPTQRRADALVLLAERSATLPEDGRRGRPLFTVLVGHDSFVKVCELTNGIQARPSQLAPYLTRAMIETIVFDGPFHAIKASSQRTFTGSLRRAVMAMHRGCTHEYCVATLEDCEVDHRQPASRAGPTDQVNGRPYCPKHNRQKGARPPNDDTDP
jgi:hypothetical protein